jgi:hypothetical protein
MKSVVCGAGKREGEGQGRKVKRGFAHERFLTGQSRSVKGNSKTKSKHYWTRN